MTVTMTFIIAEFTEITNNYMPRTGNSSKTIGHDKQLCLLIEIRNFDDNITSPLLRNPFKITTYMYIYKIAKTIS